MNDADEDMRMERRTSSPRMGRWVMQPLVWVIVTVITMVVTYIAVSPEPCSEVPACMAEYEQPLGVMSLLAVGGLATALVLEAVSLYLAYQSAKPIMGLIKGIDSTFVPPLLLCIAFMGLLLENICFAFMEVPWFVHAGGAQENRPVFTVFYAEWLINVPILLLVAGRFAMFRPLVEVSRPLLVTNVYMIIAWSAHFVSDATLRWVLVGTAFAMYGWASWDMVQWVMKFREKASKDLPSRTFRPILTISLIALFGVYGAVYVCSLEGIISSHTERVFFQVNNFGAKFLMLMAFAGIRASQYHDLITTLLVNANTSFQRQAAISGIDECWEEFPNANAQLQKKFKVVSLSDEVD